MFLVLIAHKIFPNAIYLGARAVIIGANLITSIHRFRVTLSLNLTHHIRMAAHFVRSRPGWT